MTPCSNLVAGVAVADTQVEHRKELATVSDEWANNSPAERSRANARVSPTRHRDARNKYLRHSSACSADSRLFFGGSPSLDVCEVLVVCTVRRGAAQDACSGNNGRAHFAE